MTYVIQDKHWQNGSFAVRFSFSNGVAHCEGFKTETVVSHALKLKYRILVKHPIDGKFWTMKGMENPIRLDEIQKALREKHNGYLAGDEFIFEVFGPEMEKPLFGTKFNTRDKIPANGYKSDDIVFQSFSWTFPLPDVLQKIAKEALEQHMQQIK